MTQAGQSDVLSGSWEYWPWWAVYLPQVPHFAWMGLRYRGLSTCTAANPAIPMSGIAGESKWDILSRLPSAWIVETALVPAGDAESRARVVARAVEEKGWSWPIVLKPDVGERGAGVRLIGSLEAAREYLARHPETVLAQRYHPGPGEAGIMYVRDPDRPRGQIFSITSKVFPAVEGDGRRTIRELIDAHPRYQRQRGRFLTRFGAGAERVPGAGERVRLVMAGNHCQGTMFRDGRRLITSALEETIDQIARSMSGFYFGRFDVRFGSEEELMAGRGFAIVELNGLMSESTNMYDPETSFWEGQRILREQWRWAYRIGATNRKRGARAASIGEILGAIRRHVTRGDVDLMAD